jgi:ADP-ribosylglycohydrolase
LDFLRHDDADDYAIAMVGNGIRVSEAVAAALWAFVRNWKEPEVVVGYASA